MEMLQQTGLELIRWLQSASPALDGPMLLFAFVGGIEFYLLVLPFLYWVAGPGLALRLLLLVLAADVITNLLKQVLLAPRPHWIDPGVRRLIEATSYGLPSGHASAAVAFWGTLASRRPRLRPAAIALIACIGLSRVYLGVHFPHDVVGGWLVWLAVLGLGAAVARQAGPRLAERSAGSRVGLAFALSLAIVAAGLLVRAVMADVAVPHLPALGSPQFPRDARSVEPYLTDGGLLVGVVTGIVLMQRSGGFPSAGRPAHHVSRVLIGTLGVLLTWRGLAVVFAAVAPDGSPLGDTLRYIRYALLGLWVTLAAPWLFRRLRLSAAAG